MRGVAPGRLGRQSGFVLGPEELLGDLVDGVTDVSDRLGQALAPGTELFDLTVQHPAATPQVGEHACPQLLRLLHHGAALGAGLGDQGLGLELRPFQLGGRLFVRSAPELGGSRLGLGRTVVRVLLAIALELLCLFLRQRPQSGCVVLRPGNQLGGRLVGRAQHAGRLEPERGSEGALVEHRIGRLVLGLDQGPAQLLLPVGTRRQLARHVFEEGAHLAGFEPSSCRGERVAGDLVGMDPGGRQDREPLLWHGREPTTRRARGGCQGRLRPRRTASSTATAASR